MDVRVERTKRALQEALVELAQTQPFHEITIGQIADRAAVNRSSFYPHYSDKDTRLADALDAVNENVGELFPTPTDEAPRAPSADLLVYLQRIDTHAALYRLALNEGGSAIAAQRIRRRFEQSIDAELNHYDVTAYDGLPGDVMCAGIAGAMLAVIERWLCRDPRPPVEEVASWIQRIIKAPQMK